MDIKEKFKNIGKTVLSAAFPVQAGVYKGLKYAAEKMKEGVENKKKNIIKSAMDKIPNKQIQGPADMRYPKADSKSGKFFMVKGKKVRAEDMPPPDDASKY